MRGEKVKGMTYKQLMNNITEIEERIETLLRKALIENSKDEMVDSIEVCCEIYSNWTKGDSKELFSKEVNINCIVTEALEEMDKIIKRRLKRIYKGFVGDEEVILSIWIKINKYYEMESF